MLKAGMGKFMILGAIMLILSGCGFQPLYGNTSSKGTDMRLALQQVEIALIPDREGQILHNYLLDRLNPRGRPRNPLYTLESVVSISTSSLGVSRDDTTTREKLKVTVRFTLTGKDGTSEKFVIQRVSGYSETQNKYATLEAKNDAIDRNLREIANDARSRVAAFLKSSPVQGG